MFYLTIRKPRLLNLVTHAVDILIPHKTSDGVFSNYKSDLGGSMNRNNRRDNSTFAMSVQSDATGINIESRSQKIDSRQSIIGEIIIGGCFPVARGIS